MPKRTPAERAAHEARKQRRRHHALKKQLKFITEMERIARRSYFDVASVLNALHETVVVETKALRLCKDDDAREVVADESTKTWNELHDVLVSFV